MPVEVLVVAGNSRGVRRGDRRCAADGRTARRSDGRGARLRRTARRDGVHGAGRSRRRRALSRGVSVRLRGAARHRARLRCCWPRISATRSAAGHRAGEDAGRRCRRRSRSSSDFQCADGGFALLARRSAGATSPYLTSVRAARVHRSPTISKYDVDDSACVERAYTYLEAAARAAAAGRTRWWPAYTAWQAFAVKVLVEGGRNQDSNITRLYGYRDRMPVFGLAYLLDALMAKGETRGARVDRARGAGSSNAILPEGGTRTSRS